MRTLYLLSGLLTSCEDCVPLVRTLYLLSGLCTSCQDSVPLIRTQKLLLSTSCQDSKTPVEYLLSRLCTSCQDSVRLVRTLYLLSGLCTSCQDYVPLVRTMYLLSGPPVRTLYPPVLPCHQYFTSDDHATGRGCLVRDPCHVNMGPGVATSISLFLT